MELGKVFVDSVIVGERHRTLDPEKVSALAESIKTLGLQQPISVYVDGNDAAYLVAGLHRLEAAKELGLEEIDASFVRMSPRRREMWEIAENLFRVDLSKDQRDEHIRRYAELLKAEADEEILVQNEPVLPDAKRSPGQPKGIARKIADETGLSKSTVQRALNPKPKLTVVKPAQDPLTDEDAAEKQYSRIVSAWNAAGSEARQRFREYIDTPVMDTGAFG